MLKRISFTVLLLVLVAALAACGGKKEEPTPVPTLPPAPTATTAAAEPTATEAPAPTATEAPAPTATEAPQATGDVDSALAAALAAAQAGNWSDVEANLSTAKDASTDAQQQAAIGEMIDDLGKGNQDEVLADLEKIVSGAANADPVMGKLDKGLEYAKEGN